MMTDYYFKIKNEKRNYYACYTAESYDQAVRNALFSCFSYHLDRTEIFKKEYPNVEDRFKVLFDKYRDNIDDTTKEIFEEKDQYQDS